MTEEKPRMGRVDENRVIQVTLCRKDRTGDRTWFRCKKVVGWGVAFEEAKVELPFARGTIILESGAQLWVEEDENEIASMMFGGH